jgi:hypothetical protein
MELSELLYKLVDLKIRKPEVEDHRFRRRHIETGQCLCTPRGFTHLPPQVG